MPLTVEEMSGNLDITGGVRFTRNNPGSGKLSARQQIADIFSRERWPGRLHMITMPSTNWVFERRVLNSRERGWQRYKRPCSTLFTCCENDRALYFSAVTNIPGSSVNSIQKVKPYPFAEYGYKTNIASLFFTDIDSFLAYEWKKDASWDAAWLDYTGPMTKKRLRIINNFYKKHITGILIITMLKARWNSEVSAAIKCVGSYSEWIQKHIPGKLIHSIEYCDTSPMLQIAVQKDDFIKKSLVEVHETAWERAARRYNMAWESQSTHCVNVNALPSD